MADGLGFCDAFRSNVDRQPDAPALVWHDQETTYGELFDLADQARARLAQLDLGPDEPVGVLATKSPADKFVAHPQGRDDRCYFRTGDLVRRDAQGRVFLVGRSDFQVKVRGVAINTAEVEQVLLEHPDVLEAAVVARPDPLTGRRLVSAVQRAPSSGLNSLALRAHCARRLPQAAVPATMQIVDEPLPKTSTGKVDRNTVDRLHELSRAKGRLS